jgi:glutamine synthetase
MAAIAAAGMHGLDNRLEPVGEAAVDASTVPGPKLPAALREALERFRSCEEAAEIFGADIVGHIAASADHELAVYDREVSDIERRRLFEIA